MTQSALTEPTAPSDLAQPLVAELKKRRSRGSNASSTIFLWVQIAFYRVVRTTAMMLGVVLFDLRCLGRENTYVTGGALVLSTHQSMFDPLLVGITFNERINYLAKRSLFKSRLFGAIITLLNAIELDRDRSGLAGLKETLKRLKADGKVLIFPEGTRTNDGLIGPLKPGFISVARRSKVPLMPMAVTGAYEALPKGGMFPVFYPLRVAVGPPIEPKEVSELDDDQLLAVVTERLTLCYLCAQASRAR